MHLIPRHALIYEASYERGKEGSWLAHIDGLMIFGLWPAGRQGQMASSLTLIHVGRDATPSCRLAEKITISSSCLLIKARMLRSNSDPMTLCCVERGISRGRSEWEGIHSTHAASHRGWPSICTAPSGLVFVSEEGSYKGWGNVRKR